MKELRKKTISVLMILVMLVGMLADFGWGGSVEVLAVPYGAIDVTCKDLKINGADYKEGMPVPDNAQFEFTIQWQHTNEETFPMSLDIPLPEGIKFDVKTEQQITHNGTTIGTYIVSGGYIHAKFDKTLKGNISGDFEVSGTLDGDKAQTDENGKTSLNIYDKTILINVTDSSDIHQLSVKKSYDGPYDMDKGLIFHVEVTSFGTNQNIRLDDIFDTNKLEMVDISSIEVTSTKGYKIDGGTLEQNNDGFSYVFPSSYIMENNETCSFSYQLKFKDSAFAADYVSGSNKVIASSKTDRKEVTTWFSADKNWIEKRGTYNKSDNTITWTITLNKGLPLNIAGAQLKDILPSGMKIVSDTITISGSDGFSAVIPMNSASSDFQYTFPTNRDCSGVYTVTYTTDAVPNKDYNTITGGYTDNNLAKIDIPKFGEHEKYANVYIPGIGNILDKTYTEVIEDVKNKIVRVKWKSTIKLPETLDLSDFTYSDTVAKGTWENGGDNHHLDKNTIVVRQGGQIIPSGNYKTQFTSSDNDLDYVNDTFAISFGDYFKNRRNDGDITIEYETTFKMPAENQQLNGISNTGTVTINKTSQSDTENLPYKYVPAVSKFFKGTREDNTEFLWAVTINLDNVKLQNSDIIYIREQLPENHKYVEKSIVAVKDQWNEPKEWNSNPKGITEDIGPDYITFQIDTEEVQKVDGQNNIVMLWYHTEIDDYKEFLKDKEGKNVYTNTVTALDKDQNPVGTAVADAKNIVPVQGTVLNKNFEYSASTAPNVHYYINVNTEGRMLLEGHDGEKLLLTDVMGSALQYVPNTFKVYKNPQRSEPLDNSKWKLTYDASKNTLYVELADETPCYISYEAKVLLEAGEKLENADNSVTLTGNAQTLVTDNKYLSGTVLKSSANVYTDIGFFELFKYDKENALIGIPNAEYTATICYKWVGGENGHPELFDPALESNQYPYYEPQRRYITEAGNDKNGTVIIDNIYPDKLYKIEEVAAPNGYKLNTEPVYYYIVGNDKADFNTDNLPAEFADAKIVKAVDGQVIPVFDEKEIPLETISVKKVTNSGDVLEGARLAIYDETVSTTEPILTWTSSTEPKAISVNVDSMQPTEKGVLEAGKTYTLKEELPPDGYLAAGEFKFNISTDGKINVTSGNPNFALSPEQTMITITDKPAISIRKIADDTGKLLSEARLELTKTYDSSFKRQLDSSSADKPWVLELADGEYTLTETQAPTGYQIADPITFTIEDGKIKNAPDGCVDDKGIILTMTDKAVGTLKIKKVDFADGKTPIGNIGFSLYEADGKTLVQAEKFTNTDGIIEFENIPYGTYVLKETTSLSGYVSNQDKYYVTISHKEEEITITNTKEEKNTGNISITKTNNNGTETLSGAKFKLVNDPDDPNTAEYSIEGTTDKDGVLVFTDVPYGKYLLEEVEAPFGYVLIPTSVQGGIVQGGIESSSSLPPKTVSGKTKYCIVLDGTDNNLTFRVNVYDQQLLGKLEITKTDDAAKPLQGVEFELWKDGAKFRDAQSTDAYGKCSFDNLPYGEYILKETSTPPGYEAAGDQKVTINESKDVQIKRVTVTNNRKSIFIGKTAVDDTKQLPGAEFEIRDADGNPLSPAITFTSTADKQQFYISSVHSANDELCLNTTYTLTETVPPTTVDGNMFKTGSDVKFQIVETDEKLNIKLGDSSKNAVVSSDGLTLTMQDERIGTITLTKMDAFKDTNGNNTIIPGAKFKLYSGTEALADKQIKISGLCDSDGVYTTATDGKIIIPELPYGTYLFVEQEAPAGYDMPANPNTIVVLAHPAEGVSVYNQKTTDPLAEIELLKVNAEGHPLEGAEFSLYQYQVEGDSEKLVYVASGTSDANGNVNFNNSIPYDKDNGTKCQIKETKAPKDYQLDDTGIDILLNSTTVVDGVYHPELDDSLSSDHIKVEDGKIQVVNKLITVNIQIIKQDDANEPISGITFTLLDSNGNTKFTGQTDNDGTLTIPDKSYGEYILEETEPEYHFLNGDGKIRLYLNDSTVENRSDKTYWLKNPITVTNSRKTISISKKDLNTGDLVSGATLQLTSDNGGSKTWITGTGVNPFVFYLGEQINMSENILAPGEYTLTETMAPEGKGYLISDPILFEITKDGTIKVDESKTEAYYDVKNAGTQLVMYDEPYGQIKVIKVNAKNPDARLNGAVFGLYTENDEGDIVPVTDSDGNKITGTTGKGGAEGVVTFPKVPYGTYILREEEAPSGFIKRKDDIRVTVDSKTRDVNFIVECTVANTPQVKSANIHIEKTIEDIDLLPEGFEFALYREGDFAKPILVQPVIDGKVTFSNILFGTYYIREMNAPFGYSSDPVSVTVDGKKLELYEPEDNENKPKFYKIMVGDDKTPIEITVSVVDEQAKSTLKITKVEQGTRKPIEGIRFELLRKGESDVLYSCITNEKGELVIDDGKNTKLEDIKFLYGDYVLRELEKDDALNYTFPENYIFPEGKNETPIKVDKETVEIEISNEPKTGSFTIKKLDIDNPAQDGDKDEIEKTNGLSGAVYYLYNVSPDLIDPDSGELTREPTEKERDLVAVGTTGDNGIYQFNHIPYGTYYLKEEKAPLDYDISPEYKKIVVTENSENVLYTTPVRDKKLTATFTIQKIDSITGTPLADAEFILRDENGNLVKTDENGVYVDAIKDTDENKAGDGIIRKTGDDGEIVYTELPYGSYMLTEEKAPVNYKLTQKDYSIYINEPEPVPYIVKNESVLFQISKRIKRGGVSDLEGAELQLLDSNGTVVRLPDENGELQDTWKTSSTTPKMICIGEGEGKIKSGTYMLKEVGKPVGYAVAQTLTFTVNDEGQIVATGTGFPLGKDGNPDGEIINENILVMYDDVASSVEPKPVKISKASMDGDLLDGAELKILHVDESGVVPILQPSKTEPWTTKVGTQIDEANDILLIYNEVYILREENAPKDFKKAEDIFFRINFDGEFEILSGVDKNNLYKALPESNHLIMLDEAEGEYKISISKKAIGGTEELGGTEEPQQATLQIVDENGEVVEQWQTGTEPHIVEVGGNAKVQLQKNYWLKETDAPDGYTENATGIRFWVNSDGTISSAGELDDSKTMLTMRDAVNETNTIYISKKAIDGTNELPGAHFDILISNPDGTDGAVVIKDLESSEQANRISAGDGDGYQLQFNQVYILRETKAPDGYLTTDDIRFAVQPDGTMLIADEKHLPVLNSEALSADGKTLTMRDPVDPTPDAFTGEDGVPKTGDDTPIVLLILLLIAAVVVIAGLFVTGRKKGRREEAEDDTEEEDKN